MAAYKSSPDTISQKTLQTLLARKPSRHYQQKNLCFDYIIIVLSDGHQMHGLPDNATLSSSASKIESKQGVYRRKCTIYYSEGILLNILLLKQKCA